MFKFLKEKLKKAVGKFSKDIEEEAEDIEEEIEVKEEKKKALKKKEAKKEEKKEVKKAEKKEKPKLAKPGKKEEKKPVEKKKPEKEEKIEKEDKVKIKISEILEDSESAKEQIEEEKEEVEQLLEDDKKLQEMFKTSEKSLGELTKEEIVEKEKEKMIDVEEAEAEKETPEEMAEEIEEEEAEEAEEEIEEEVKEEKKGFFSRLFKRKKKEEIEEAEEVETAEEVEEEIEEVVEEVEKPEKPRSELEQEPEEEVEEEVEEEEEKKKPGFFKKIKQTIVSKKLSESKFEDLFFELEVALLENNVAVEVIERIKDDLKKELVDHKLNRFDIEKIIFKTLKETLTDILDFAPEDIVKKVKSKKPYVIVFVGVNGSGKTTTIGKVARLMQNNKLKPIMVAADTFRAAAIQQLEEHANNLGVKLIKHDYGSDPAAVAFDAIKYAEAKDIDVVLIDTAGRLHSNVNLMDEMKKIIRVAKPDMKIFIGESITGNDCVEQAKQFDKAVEIDGIILAKADVDEKGGAAVSVSYVTGKPILYLGTGQTYDDLKPFEKDLILKNLGL